MNTCTRVRALRSCSGDVIVGCVVVHAAVGLMLVLISHVVVVVPAVAFP